MTMTDDPRVVFHIGAHKTATSHLQRSLREAADDLATAGVQYYGPQHFRLPGRSLQALFGLKENARNAPKRAAKDQLALLCKGAERLVISEENYIGVLNSPRRRTVKLRYPHAAKRVNALAEALNVGGLDICLGIRQPARFLNSAYGQMLLGGRFMTMDRFTQINPLGSVNWLSLAKRLSRAKGVRQLTIWRYEDYRDVFPQICGALVGTAGAGLVQPIGRKIHMGLSQAAVDVVQFQHDKGVKDRVANRARKTYSVDAGHAAFDGFSAAEHLEADQHYQKQIAAISALPKVTFLRPNRGEQ